MQPKKPSHCADAIVIDKRNAANKPAPDSFAIRGVYQAALRNSSRIVFLTTASSDSAPIACLSASLIKVWYPRSPAFCLKCSITTPSRKMFTRCLRGNSCPSDARWRRISLPFAMSDARGGVSSAEVVTVDFFLMSVGLSH